MTDQIPDEQTPVTPARSRHRLRLAAIGGIAAIAILGGGITAVASAAAPSTTTTLAPPSGSTPTSGTAEPSGPAAPGTAAPGTGTPPKPELKAHTPHLDGTVTSVSGSTVLIKDHEGFTRTIVTSSKTTYTDGLKAALAVGTKIHADGAVDANGTSLDATSIGKAPTPPAGGPGGFGPGGGHGPGGRGPGGDHGDRPVPPTGTAPTSGSGTSAPSTSKAPSTS